MQQLRITIYSYDNTNANSPEQSINTWLQDTPGEGKLCMGSTDLAAESLDKRKWANYACLKCIHRPRFLQQRITQNTAHVYYLHSNQIIFVATPAASTAPMHILGYNTAMHLFNTNHALQEKEEKKGKKKKNAIVQQIFSQGLYTKGIAMI